MRRRRGTQSHSILKWPLLSGLFVSPNIRRHDLLLDFMKQTGCYFQLTFSIPQRCGFICVAYEWYHNYKVDQIWGNSYRKILPVGRAGVIVVYRPKSDLLPRAPNETGRITGCYVIKSEHQHQQASCACWIIKSHFFIVPNMAYMWVGNNEKKKQ